jgi:hypothetical protein
LLAETLNTSAPLRPVVVSGEAGNAPAAPITSAMSTNSGAMPAVKNPSFCAGIANGKGVQRGGTGFVYTASPTAILPRLLEQAFSASAATDT